MSDETKEPRVKIENLPEQEKELTTDEVKAVKGGAKGQKWIKADSVDLPNG